MSLNFNKDFDKTVPRNFNVSLYGDLEPYAEGISKCRVRIFYKGLNRNRTFITEDFANQLISSLPYTPVKGIFNTEDVDFTDHGDENRDGKIYGVVMADPNFAWEDHVDTDGVTRTYACADVILYTQLYSEAKIIPGSSQSMEINPYTFSGEWKIWEDGMPYYEFKTGSLFGLQVLGMATEPCFEGASFYYNLIQEDLKPFIDYIKQIEKKEESKKMDKVLFRLSDAEKAEKIWDALNPNFNEDGNWAVDYYICDVYEDYAIVRAEDGFKRAYYSKNDETDTVSIEKLESCFITDVTEAEMNALNAMKAAAGTYEIASEKIVLVNSLETEVADLKSQLEAKIEESEPVVENSTETSTETSTEEPVVENAADEGSTVTEPALDNATEVEPTPDYEAIIADKDNAIAAEQEKYSALEAEKIRLESEKADLISERDSLVEYKKTIETEKKNEILAKYSEHLSDEAIENFKSTIDNYSIADFKKEICTAAVENNPSIFSKQEEPEPMFAKSIDESDKGLSGMERILNRYKNGGNK